MYKRGFDIVCALFLLAAAIPILAIAAIVIKLDSTGPALFRQERMGRRQRIFRLYKLRTMVSGAHGPAYTPSADPRLTRVGGWLRRFKIDELPQLWNVLRGEMSMVGPRPVVPQIAREFGRAYAGLLAVRPGLTDPASLKYCNEADLLKSVADAERHFKKVITPDKIRISTAYMQRATLWSDLGVIAGTGLAIALPFVRKRYCRSAAPLPQIVRRPVSIARPVAARRKPARSPNTIARQPFLVPRRAERG